MRADGGAVAAAVLYEGGMGLAGAVSPLLAAAGRLPLLGPAGRAGVGVRLAGAGVAVAGLGLAWVAQSAMGTSWRIGVDESEDTALVTGGIFATVRNPIFTAMIAAQAGTAMMAPTWLSVAGVGLLVTACQVQVRGVEEPYLVRRHGSGYLSYAARTGRFLPRLGRLHPAPRPVAGQA